METQGIKQLALLMDDKARPITHGIGSQSDTSQEEKHSRCSEVCLFNDGPTLLAACALEMEKSLILRTETLRFMDHFPHIRYSARHSLSPLLTLSSQETMGSHL